MKDKGITYDPHARYANSQRTWVSILNWNGTEATLRCLAAIDRASAPELHFTVLDNGSRADPSARFRSECPDVEFIRIPENLGFTGGHNLLIKQALARGFGSVLLLNNDCVLSVEGIRVLRKELDMDPRVGMVSPLILRDDGSERPMAAAGWFDWARHKTIRPSDPDVRPPAGVQSFLVGTALLVRCETLHEVGILDDRYFAYFEDNDISARVAKSGWLATYCSGAVCYHDYRALHEYGPHALYLMTRNAWLFWLKHTPPEARKGLCRTLVARAFHDLGLLKKNEQGAEKMEAVLVGMWHGLRGRFGSPPTVFRVPAGIRHLATWAPFLLSKLVTSPWQTLRSKLPL